MTKPVRKATGNTGRFDGSVGEGAKSVPSPAPASALSADTSPISTQPPVFPVAADSEVRSGAIDVMRDIIASAHEADDDESDTGLDVDGATFDDVEVYEGHALRWACAVVTLPHGRGYVAAGYYANDNTNHVEDLIEVFDTEEQARERMNEWAESNRKEQAFDGDDVDVYEVTEEDEENEISMLAEIEFHDIGLHSGDFTVSNTSYKEVFVGDGVSVDIFGGTVEANEPLNSEGHRFAFISSQRNVLRGWRLEGPTVEVETFSTETEAQYRYEVFQSWIVSL